ncbi:MAG: porin family protein [Acidobacteria bacterium]|nr:porin family protein [Acidobacteriota bacterium]
MRRMMLILFVMTLAPAIGMAQTVKEHRGQGYVFVAPGAVSSDGTTATLHFGVGGEGLVYKGLGIGGEIGYVGPARGLQEGVGLFSANGSYHFRNASASGKLVPFVTGGYSLIFRDGTASGVNFGGGVNYWFRERVGLRLEFRDQVFADRTTHFYGFRIGLAFR